jgi:hypothetical protein
MRYFQEGRRHIRVMDRRRGCFLVTVSQKATRGTARDIRDKQMASTTPSDWQVGVRCSAEKLYLYVRSFSSYLIYKTQVCPLKGPITFPFLNRLPFSLLHFLLPVASRKGYPTFAPQLNCSFGFL